MDEITGSGTKRVKELSTFDVGGGLSSWKTKIGFQAKRSGYAAVLLFGMASTANALPTALLTHSDVEDMIDSGGRAGFTLGSSQCVSGAKKMVFCASITGLLKGSGFERSGLVLGDKIVAVESFRPEDVDTEIKLIHSFPPNSILKLTVVSAKDGVKRQIIGRMVAESVLLAASQTEFPRVTVEAKRSQEVVQYVARAKAKEQCEHEHPKTVPNVVGGAVGTKVGTVVASVACAPFLTTIAVGDPGLAYLTCTAVVTMFGTASGVVIATTTVDNAVKECTDTMVSKASQ